jgi:SM-20-related protein
MRSVEIEVTLTGGQTFASVLPANSPLLTDLYVGLANSQAGDAQQPGVLVQFPIDEGRAAVSFMSTSVASITSRPAVLIQATQSAAWPTATMPAYVRIDDFLTPAENEQLLEYAIENQDHFEISKVIDDSDSSGETHRKSMVLFAIKDSKWNKIFIERLKQHLPHITASLGVPSFRFQGTEIQLTASSDGDFFKRHADADHKEDSVASRVLTFVYYLHRLPKPFSGGDLLLYGPDTGEQVTAIEPQNNCLISFVSTCWHEVDFVRCPSRAFADSRFTINGWLRSDTV